MAPHCMDVGITPNWMKKHSLKKTDVSSLLLLLQSCELLP